MHILTHKHKITSKCNTRKTLQTHKDSKTNSRQHTSTKSQYISALDRHTRHTETDQSRLTETHEHKMKASISLFLLFLLLYLRYPFLYTSIWVCLLPSTSPLPIVLLMSRDLEWKHPYVITWLFWRERDTNKDIGGTRSQIAKLWCLKFALKIPYLLF